MAYRLQLVAAKYPASYLGQVVFMLHPVDTSVVFLRSPVWQYGVPRSSTSRCVRGASAVSPATSFYLDAAA